MATKRVPTGKKTARRKSPAATDLTDSAAMAVLESAESATSVPKTINPDVRRQLVAAEAYFLAERRGFAAGHELEDWVAAEEAVDSRIRQMRAA